MLQAGPELTAPAPSPATASLWFPGKNAQPADVTAGNTSARAQEIARRRDELFGMLHDLPESEYELSLTDLVEKSGGGMTDTKEASPASREASSRRPEQAGKERRRRDSSSSFRSSSDGVLLNFYMPSSLTRSFTAPRPSRPRAATGRSRVSADCNKRDRDNDSVKCWPSLWDGRWRKSRRQASKAPDECPASIAILKSANYSTSSAKF